MTDRTPWPAMLAVAQRLGVAPPDFWRLSLAEWRALSAPPTAETLTRAAFAVLARRYPDRPQ